ncbi:hypothetical protein GGR52DRAFT_580523 [Hypoxylon sp. FL1284]|nr:hypothetical protein GGR52DRAFT_580523 [Hypoxylon sp. FL1284]
MEDELTLPKLPAVSWDSETQTFTNRRKRGRGGTLTPAFNNSSDPAVFSSDDDPHVDNYTQGRHRKKRYVGSWFQQHPVSSDSTFSEAPQPLPKPKRILERQLDSGVWMGSDGSVDTEDDVVERIKTPTEPRLPQLRHARPVPVVSPIEQAARDKIQRAIDDGIPAVDLSSSNLESISNKTISQISIFDTVLNPDFPDAPKDTFTKLFLSNNPLLRAPGAVFNLQYLSVLSLRNTQITELPPSIGNLRNLETLNLSLTRLRYLPGELLDLLKYPSKLHTLTIHPNPFYRPDHIASSSTRDDEWDKSLKPRFYKEFVVCLNGTGTVLRHWLNRTDDHRLDRSRCTSTEHLCPGWEVHALARSPLQYNDSRGAIVSKFQLPQLRPSEPENSNAELPSDLVIETENMQSPPALPRATRNTCATSPGKSRVLSLFELALQACSRSGQLRELSSYLPPNAPAHFTKLLDEIAARVEEHDNPAGDLPCSVCGRRVMVPVAQWIEWWRIGRKDKGRTNLDLEIRPVGSSEDEMAIPFLRRGCSLRCLPRPMEAGERLSGTMRCVFHFASWQAR